MRVILFILFPLLAYSQFDTVHVYDGISIFYMTRKDTVLISSRKWNDVLGIIRSKEKTIGDYKSIINNNESTIKSFDLQIAEHKSIERNLEERVGTYQRAYDMSSDKITELNNLWQQGLKYAGNERKRGIFIGTTWGIIGGFAAGIITTVILLK
jgi:hypothetical protein